MGNLLSEKKGKSLVRWKKNKNVRTGATPKRLLIGGLSDRGED